MIAVRAVLDADGLLVRFEATGHSGRSAAGNDIVCAAFTVLARTAYESLAALPGVDLSGSAPKPGTLHFTVKRIDPPSRERAAGMTDFLLAGISGLEREYPGEVGFTIERYWRE
jgi:uncharacterized protein YsxB (DUF464 family)